LSCAILMSWGVARAGIHQGRPGWAGRSVGAAALSAMLMSWGVARAGIIKISVRAVRAGMGAERPWGDHLRRMKGLGPAQLGPRPGLGGSDGLYHPLRHDILILILGVG
jgi:hypothetical protein